MSDHGVTLPERGQDQSATGSVAPPVSIDRNSATFKAANDVCAALLPTPPQGGTDPRDQPVKRKTLLLNSVLAVTAVGLVAFGITSLGGSGSASATETETAVHTGNVTQTVSATGNAVAAEDLTLNFAGGGTLDRGRRRRRPDGHPRASARPDRQHDGRRTS